MREEEKQKRKRAQKKNGRKEILEQKDTTNMKCLLEASTHLVSAIPISICSAFKPEQRDEDMGYLLPKQIREGKAHSAPVSMRAQAPAKTSSCLHPIVPLNNPMYAAPATIAPRSGKNTAQTPSQLKTLARNPSMASTLFQAAPKPPSRSPATMSTT